MNVPHIFSYEPAEVGRGKRITWRRACTEHPDLFKECGDNRPGNRKGLRWMWKTSTGRQGMSKDFTFELEGAMWEGFLQVQFMNPCCFPVVLQMVHRRCNGFYWKPVKATVLTYISHIWKIIVIFQIITYVILYDHYMCKGFTCTIRLCYQFTWDVTLLIGYLSYFFFISLRVIVYLGKCRYMHCCFLYSSPNPKRMNQWLKRRSEKYKRCNDNSKYYSSEQGREWMSGHGHRSNTDECSICADAAIDDFAQAASKRKCGP